MYRIRTYCKVLDSHISDHEEWSSRVLRHVTLKNLSTFSGTWCLCLHGRQILCIYIFLYICISHLSHWRCMSCSWLCKSLWSLVMELYFPLLWCKNVTKNPVPTNFRCTILIYWQVWFWYNYTEITVPVIVQYNLQSLTASYFLLSQYRMNMKLLSFSIECGVKCDR